MAVALLLDKEFKKPSENPSSRETACVRKQFLASQPGGSGAVLSESACESLGRKLLQSFALSSGPAAGPDPPQLEGSQASSPRRKGPPACGWALCSLDSKLSVSLEAGLRDADPADCFVRFLPQLIWKLPTCPQTLQVFYKLPASSCSFRLGVSNVK